MKKRSNLGVCIRLMGLVKPLAGFMVLAVALGLLGHLCAVLIPVLGSLALLDILGVTTHGTANTIFVLVVVFALLRGILRYGEQYCNHFIAFKLLALIRDSVFTALRRLCPAKLDGKEKGNLIAVITADIELLEVFYAHTLSPILIAVLMALCMGALLGHLHPLLAGIAWAAYLAVGAVIPLAATAATGAGGARLRGQAGALSAFVLDSLRGLAETLQYGQGEHRLGALLQKTEALATSEKAMKARAGTTAAVTQSVILLFDTLMLVGAATLYGRGSIGFAGVLVAVVALMSSFGPFVSLANLGAGLQNTFAAGNRVLDILDETPATEEITGQPEVTFNGAKAENLSFSYGGKAVLQQVCAEFPQGQVVGIVGKSGSGKSTLLKLLMRFWAAQGGSITISGRQVNEINTANLRGMQSYLTQETHLFHDSIANNLRIAKLDATQQELEAACQKAAIHEFIRGLPQGYDTPVGELGDTLSGGERQRLGLARAFLHDAPWLLLDEPTSNLDSLNEALILKSIAAQRGSKTVVLVSHRASTMRLASRVYSVERGRLHG
ncbi:MAG: ABC transporter ATP-binding protein [Gemmiger sp.]|nr:ABC transporter ATP-binding protein [Gemmiger sp.]